MYASCRCTDPSAAFYHLLSHLSPNAVRVGTFTRLRVLAGEMGSRDFCNWIGKLLVATPFGLGLCNLLRHDNVDIISEPRGESCQAPKFSESFLAGVH